MHYGDEDEDGVEQTTTVTVPTKENGELEDGQEVGKPRSERDADKGGFFKFLMFFKKLASSDRSSLIFLNLPQKY